MSPIITLLGTNDYYFYGARVFYLEFTVRFFPHWWGY